MIKGTHYTLQQGDCSELLNTLDNECIDAVITDPPYSSGGFGNSNVTLDTRAKYSVRGTKKRYPLFFGDTRDQLSHLHWLWQILGQCYRVAKSGAWCMVFSDWRQFAATELAVQMAGFSLRGVAVWDKTHGVRPNEGRFSQQAEFIILASKGAVTGSGAGTYHHGLFSCATLKGGKYHQTGKPLEVMKWLVAATPTDGLILDPFMGSGSTGVACLELGRSFIGCEMSTEYIEIAHTRLDATQKADG